MTCEQASAGTPGWRGVSAALTVLAGLLGYIAGQALTMPADAPDAGWGLSAHTLGLVFAVFVPALGHATRLLLLCGNVPVTVKPPHKFGR